MYNFTHNGLISNLQITSPQNNINYEVRFLSTLQTLVT